MAKRNENQQQAYDMLQKLPAMQLVEKSFGRYKNVSLCLVNNRIFTSVSDLGFYAVAHARKKFNAGLIGKKDMIPVRFLQKGSAAGAMWLISADTIKQFQNEIINEWHCSREVVDFVCTWLDKNDARELNDYKLTDKQIDDIHFNYEKRVWLLYGSWNEINKEIRESNKPFVPLPTKITDGVPAGTSSDELTLEQLVDRIEAMGWTVTLHRKDGVGTTGDQGTEQGSTAVPSWYDDEIYKMFSMKLIDTGLSIRMLNALRPYGITTLGQVVSMSRRGLLAIRYFGKKTLTELYDYLESIGLDLDTDLDKWHEAHKVYLANDRKRV